ncbi:DNA-3-methyladenine glycosylase I [Pullulanibacillus pueri]|uniref:DNA-3-methyladenine glycosylase I n=1 Tax=Pullulanibacillus pueri TaxID=1437324 RepID=A0A8J3EM05_9BACL|nr:DNA-3-methyladenine glycosylase I [Pullulanibacillus pueri]MBM7680849.1 DNA-3-methyladenine glycosylase I [Pullulanibacillus pueri]GGH78568.1 DNA-3-methyladenine glycosylase [Pullulanibacillus pueri]
MVERCGWVNEDPLYIDYHDKEWGVPVHDDQTLFEFLILEGAQAGLSWYTVLKKRENYRVALDGFDVDIIANYPPEKVDELIQNEGLIRNRRKLESVITNAQAFKRVQDEFGSFSAYLWGYVQGEPIVNCWSDLQQVPANTPLSDQISKDLKKRGFKFIGTTIIYAYLQATGVVNDHIKQCICSKCS